MRSDPNLCRYCGQAPATIGNGDDIGDPDLGSVCASCYVDLISARAFLEEVGYIVGIARCQEKPSQ